MKKIIYIAITMIGIALLGFSLSGCSGDTYETKDSMPLFNEEYTEIDTLLTDNEGNSSQTSHDAERVADVVTGSNNVEHTTDMLADDTGYEDSYEYEGIGGDYWWQNCIDFHGFICGSDASHTFLLEQIITHEEYWEWAIPLWAQEEATGECLDNIFTQINHFNISRETVEGLFDIHIRYWFWFGGESLDVLFSGNRALFDSHFAPGGPAETGFWERYDYHRLSSHTTAQREVLENTSEMSRYFHDIWTYQLFDFAMDTRLHWMQDLISKGEYDRVNIVEFISHFNLGRPSPLSPGRTIFEHWANEYNMSIFTHYNFDILLSGDENLIRQYYAIENEPLHTAAREARFDAYVAQHGMPDTSWMLPDDIPRLQTPANAVVFHFDDTEIRVELDDYGYLNPEQIPTPATRYGRVGIPGQIFMGWFTQITPEMYSVLDWEVPPAEPFDLTRNLSEWSADNQGNINLYAGWLQYGDVDGNGVIDSEDLTMLRTWLLGAWITMHHNTADVNVDGQINAVDRSMLQSHLLGIPGIILGVREPAIPLNSYNVTFFFGRQAINLPIANGGINMQQITEEELLLWELELLNHLHQSALTRSRDTTLPVQVNNLTRGTPGIMRLDTSALQTTTAVLVERISAVETELAILQR